MTPDQNPAPRQAIGFVKRHEGDSRFLHPYASLVIYGYDRQPHPVRAMIDTGCSSEMSISWRLALQYRLMNLTNDDLPRPIGSYRQADGTLVPCIVWKTDVEWEGQVRAFDVYISLPTQEPSQGPPLKKPWFFGKVPQPAITTASPPAANSGNDYPLIGLSACRHFPQFKEPYLVMHLRLGDAGGEVFLTDRL